jgi:hypothetical protein
VPMNHGHIRRAVTIAIAFAIPLSHYCQQPTPAAAEATAAALAKANNPLAR